MNMKHTLSLLLILIAIAIAFVLSNQDDGNRQSTSEDVHTTPELSADYAGVVAMAPEPVISTQTTRKSIEQSRLTAVDGSSVEGEAAATRGTTVIVEVVNASGVAIEGCVVDADFQHTDAMTGIAVGKTLHWSGNTPDSGLVVIPVKAWPLEASCQIQVTARSKMNEIASSSLALTHGEERRMRLELLDTISCSGHVFSSNDRMPLAGISVIAKSHGIQCSAITDDSGAFSVPLVSRLGSGRICFESEFYSDEVVDTTLEANGSWTASIWEQEGRKLLALDSLPMYLEVPLSPACAVTGVIKSWEGKPISGASIKMTGYYMKLPGAATTDRGAAVSDKAGKFKIMGLRADINHSMYVQADGFAGFQMVVPPVYSVEGRAVDLGEIPLEAAIAIQGTVTDIYGTPAEGLVVRARLLGQRKTHRSSSARPQSKQRGTAAAAWPDFSARVGSDGRYLLPGRQSGRYSIAILDEGRREMRVHFDGAMEATLEIEFSVDSNKNEIDIVLGLEEQSIGGKVKLPEKWDGGYVELTHGPSRASRRVSFSGSGDYTICGVKADSIHEYTLRAFVLIGESNVLASSALTFDEVASGKVLEFAE